MKKTVVKILNIVVTVLIVLVLIASAFVLVVTFTSKSENGGVPNFFGKAPISVLTNSMKGDGSDNFSAGDLIVCDIVPEDDRPVKTYKVGDVVTFPVDDLNDDGYDDYLTHRIIKVNKDGTYQTKGDNNDTYDQDPKGTTVLPNLKASDVVAVYHGFKIGGIGGFLNYIHTQQGFLLVVLIPMIIFFLYQAVRVVINIISYSKEKALEKAKLAIANADLTEEQKQRAIEEYLAAQNAAEQNASPEPEPDAAPEENSDEAETE